MITRPHWSYSQLSKYMRCPLQYWFDHVLRLPKPFVTSGLALGAAVHEALATYHRSLKDGSPSDREAIQGIFLKKWMEREAKEKIRYSEGDKRDDVLEQGRSVLNAYFHQPPPQEIIAVEESFLSPLVTSEGEVLDNHLLSVLDLLTREEAGLKITDFKTSGRSMSLIEADTSLQATCYANAVNYAFEESARFQFVVLVKTKTPRVQQVPTERTGGHLERLGDLVQAVEGAIAERVFYPIETPLNCSTCPYRKECKNWRGESRVLDSMGLKQEDGCSRSSKEKEAVSVSPREKAEFDVP